MTSFSGDDEITDAAQECDRPKGLLIQLSSDQFSFPMNTAHEGGLDELADEADDCFFTIKLDEYLSALGGEQKRLRAGLASSLAQSTNLIERIRMVLDTAASLRSQDSLLAAIDLLSELDNGVVQMATRAAFETKSDDENAVFMLAMAAGRRQKRLIKDVFLLSHHPAMREAAIELLASLEPLEAKPTLERVAREDESPALRHRAAKILDEFD